jgi:hypothetical protein
MPKSTNRFVKKKFTVPNESPVMHLQKSQINFKNDIDDYEDIIASQRSGYNRPLTPNSVNIKK